MSQLRLRRRCVVPLGMMLLLSSLSIAGAQAPGVRYAPGYRPGAVAVPTGRPTTAKPAYVGIMGQVAKPGVYAVTGQFVELDAIIHRAGGMTANASRSIRIVRNGSPSQQVFYNPGQRVSLMAGDLVVISRQASSGVRSAHASGSALKGTQIGLVNVLPRPVVLKVPAHLGTAQAIGQALGQSAEVLSRVQVYTPVPNPRLTPNTPLPSGAVIIFAPGSIDGSKLPSFPPPVGEATPAPIEVGSEPVAEMPTTAKGTPVVSVSQQGPSLIPSGLDSGADDASRSEPVWQTSGEGEPEPISVPEPLPITSAKPLPSAGDTTTQPEPSESTSGEAAPTVPTRWVWGLAVAGILLVIGSTVGLWWLKREAKTTQALPREITPTAPRTPKPLPTREPIATPSVPAATTTVPTSPATALARLIAEDVTIEEEPTALPESFTPMVPLPHLRRTPQPLQSPTWETSASATNSNVAADLAGASEGDTIPLPAAITPEQSGTEQTAAPQAKTDPVSLARTAPIETAETEVRELGIPQDDGFASGTDFEANPHAGLLDRVLTQVQNRKAS